MRAYRDDAATPCPRVRVASFLLSVMFAAMPRTLFSEKNSAIQKTSKTSAPANANAVTGGTKTLSDSSRIVRAVGSRSPLASSRDPFRVTDHKPGRSSFAPEEKKRLPGIGGLLVGELQLRGLVEERTSHKMMAVVTNGGNLAYFLHENDQLCDGTVTRITQEAVYFSRKATPSGASPSTGPVVLHLQPQAGDKP